LDFRWNEWNVEHLARHGVEPEAAEAVVEAAARGYPRRMGEDKWLVWGADDGGNQLQVVFVLEEDGSVFVIHARPLTEAEKRRHRRRVR
jgi:uncharacterized DUF497 family protein